MELTITFLMEIGLVVVLLGVLVIVLVSLRRRDGSNGAQPRTRAEDIDREVAQAPQNQREFLKSTGFGKNEEIKLRLYSPGEYRKELNGGPSQRACWRPSKPTVASKMSGCICRRARPLTPSDSPRRIMRLMRSTRSCC